MPETDRGSVTGNSLLPQRRWEPPSGKPGHSHTPGNLGTHTGIRVSQGPRVQTAISSRAGALSPSSHSVQVQWFIPKTTSPTSSSPSSPLWEEHSQQRQGDCLCAFGADQLSWKQSFISVTWLGLSNWSRQRLQQRPNWSWDQYLLGFSSGQGPDGGHSWSLDLDMGLEPTAKAIERRGLSMQLLFFSI